MLSLRTHKQSWLALFVFTPLFALLFQYRILSLLKRLGANVTPIGTKFPLVLDFQTAPQWLLPIYHTVDYLNAIWFTTILGLFIAGAAAAFLPRLVQSRLKGNGMGQIFVGMLFGLPSMFCSCCSVGAATGLRKAGASLGPTLAYFVTAPMLNLVVILLAFELLPLKLALARLILGFAAAIGVTYVVARLVHESGAEVFPAAVAQDDQTSKEMLTCWLRHTWDITKTVIPLLLVGLLVIGMFKTILPFETIARQFGDGWLPTLVASAIGTILMAPTFTEVLWVQEFTRQGMGMGPAVALLATLPAVSFPSLWVLGRVLKSYKAVAYLAILIFGLGLIGGMLFSAI